MSTPEGMVFQKLGGDYHLVIDRPEQLAAVAELNKARWVATSVPIDSLHGDPAFLKLVDTDADGRIRADELREAQQWLFHRLTDLTRLPDQTDSLPLAAIDISHDEGKAVHAAAMRVLQNLGSPDAEEITLSQVHATQQIMATAETNGDGVIPAEAVADADLSAFIKEVTTAVGAVPDAGGQEGVNSELLDRFVQEAEAHLDWLERGRSAEAGADDLLVWGAETADAYRATAVVRDKIDEYFTLCDLAALSPELGECVQPSVKDLDIADRSAVAASLRQAPIATPTPASTLMLDENLNPAWRQEIEAFAAESLVRLPDAPRDRLTRDTWDELTRILTPYRNWFEDEKGQTVAPLGEDRLRCILQGPLVQGVRDLIERDKAVADELAAIADLERLLLFHRELLELANNMVSFPRFYDPDKRSLVEAGTLVMDGRRFALNVKVQDRAAHKKIAERSHIFVVYLEVTRADGSEKFEIASAVTAGDTGDIAVGKRGVFVTLDGREWDATVTDTIPNPVGLWEALKQPFQRLGAAVGAFTEKFSTSRTAEAEKGLTGTLTQAEKSLQVAPPTAPAPPSKSSAVRDLLVGGGVAVAALGSTFAYVAAKIKEINAIWPVLCVLLGILAIITVPTLIVAAAKLRRRNMRALLEASGWAVNMRMHLPLRLGGLFTQRPRFPAGSRKRRFDLARRFSRSLSGPRNRILAAVCLGILLLALGLAVWWTLKMHSQVRTRAWPTDSARSLQPSMHAQGQDDAYVRKKGQIPVFVGLTGLHHRVRYSQIMEEAHLCERRQSQTPFRA